MVFSLENIYIYINPSVLFYVRLLSRRLTDAVTVLSNKQPLTYGHKIYIRLWCSSLRLYKGKSQKPKYVFCSKFVCLLSRRLTDVVTVLSNQQPACPQLYVYSSADAVIPATSVEAFIEEQKKAGRMVKACNFETSPHVDHFRSHPEKYSEQLTCFLKVCMPQWVH